MYEFEAHLRLSHHGNLQAILDSVSSQSRTELKTLETMAGTFNIVCRFDFERFDFKNLILDFHLRVVFECCYKWVCVYVRVLELLIITCSLKVAI